jgi:hypothetical protein
MTPRQSWALAGALLAALALGGCNKPQGGNTPQAEAGTTGAATAGAAPQPGTGLNGGLGTGMTASFPATSTGTGVATGTLGNNEGSTNTTSGNAVGQRP